MLGGQWFVRGSGLCAAVALLSGAITAVAAPTPWSVASGGNGHAYELKTLEMFGNWTGLPGRVDDFAYEGVTGHLATVTSAGELQFLLETFGSDSEKLVFLGGNDAATPGNWYWQDGPEEGTLFWDEQTGATPTYANWAPGQPNRPDVHYLAMSLKTGGWYDTNNGGYTGGPVRVSGYLVEYSLPEPATLALLGLGGLAVLRKRR